MKKTKTYDISVIDKTYSKTISDETKFYTSDTSLELVFKLKETEYTFESVEIVLLNIDDRSLVTRTVAKVLDSFTYELDDDIIAHYGDWRGQLRFEQVGEVYVSSPVKFRIENDLSNERPPQLSDVQSWVSLKRYADSLTEELKQAVLSVEGIEDTFDENETIRQNQFDSVEQSRQTTFETNESLRNETFNANETTRQTQELEREKAESQRQQAESQRQSTFETNESERQTTFETAEQERQSTFETTELTRGQAESSRVSAEEQRKIDHANRSAELEGKADKVVFKNLVENGDFSEGMSGWLNFNERLSYIDNNTHASFTNVSDYGRIMQRVESTTPANLYYIGAYIKTDSTNVGVGNGSIIKSHHPGDGQYHIVSLNDTLSSNYYSVISNVLGDSFDAQWVVSINLTEAFGSGNEPTKSEMDELLKINGYIDGEYALNNKEMLTWTFALIRRNKNAIITLGGTI